jgi:predicted transcriptional regulator YdeE
MIQMEPDVFRQALQVGESRPYFSLAVQNVHTAHETLKTLGVETTPIEHRNALLPTGFRLLNRNDSHPSSAHNLIKGELPFMIIETKIVEKPAFSAVGITEAILFDSSLPPSENAIAKLWSRFGKEIPNIPGQLGWRSFGLMLHNPDNPPGAPFNYMAAVQIFKDGDIPEGMTRIEVPAARYIALTLRGPLDEISDAFKHFWGHWLPNSPYEYDGGTQTGKYEFELYDQRYTQPNDPNSEIDLYFPIRAK